MVEDFLPIRTFKQRGDDNLRVEGGGNKETPNWVLQGEDLIQHAQELNTELLAGLDALAHNPDLPYVFEVKLDGRDTAKSKRKSIVDMLDVSAPNDIPNVLGLRGSSSLVVQARDVNVVSQISERINDYESYDWALSCIASIQRFKPEVHVNEEYNIYKVRLVDFGVMADRYERSFESYLAENSIEFRRSKYANGLTVYRVIADVHQAHVILDGSMNEALFSFKPMPRYSVVLDSSESDELPDVIMPNDEVDYPIVGILDSGIERIDHLAPWLIEPRWSPYPGVDLDPSHGTFVAGITLYGDMLEQKSWIGGLTPHTFDAAVFPGNGLVAEDELINNIRRIIALKCNEIRIWNLSISITRPIKEDDFSDFAKALDEIQDEFNVLICKSAGNCQFDQNGSKGRLHEGADSIRALTVGSAVHIQGQYDIAEVGQASPFSRKGPGPEFIIKPEVSHYGGNAGFLPDGSVTRSDVLSFGPDGAGASAVGTSFSTPRIAALAANLENSLLGEFDPLLIKALIAHSALFPGDTLIPADEKVKEMGFGIPCNVSSILSDDIHEATLILQGTLEKKKKIDIMDFPMPDSLIRDGFYSGQITLTIAYSPILDTSQGGEYCQSDIDLKFGAYSEKVSRDISKPMIMNPIGRKDSINVLLTSKYSKPKIQTAADDFALRERMLIQYEGKYAPVKKYAIDLDDLTPKNREKIQEGSLWFLSVEGLFRDHTERKAQKSNEILDQNYCLIITVRDPRGEALVYNDVSQMLTQNHFWHNNIGLTNQARASIRR